MKKSRLRGGETGRGLGAMIGRYPRATAFHEAGHAVVAHCVGLQVTRILINSDDESGGTDTLPYNDLATIDQATFLFAGLQAQNIWQARPVPVHLIGGKDFGDFNTLTKDLSDKERDALRFDAYERANRLLLANKAKVEAVAKRLMERGQMEGSEFMRLMGGAPDCYRADSSAAS
jgi:ATP-dependent Zn protease